jgi:ethanolamine permease
MSDFDEGHKLDRSLGPLMLWGLGVGYVISGMYFGWNLGLPAGGTLGMAIATFFIIIMYLTFTFSYTELACAIPKAGGAFDYARKALGPNWGFLAGMAQNIEFIFAPPAIAFAIGAYLDTFIAGNNIIPIAIGAYFIFTFINIRGVKVAALFELVITIIAVLELLIFAGITLPSFEFSNLAQNPLPNGIPGIFAAIPFAIWFFLAIEGVANVAEETKNPQKNIVIGFGSAILTLVVLCILTFVSSIGVAGWEAVVFKAGTSEALDTPLPLALSHIVGDNSWLMHLLVSVGIFGLVASFHGIILAAGRATFEFGRVGYAPKILGTTHKKFKTPAMALLLNMCVGIVALLTGKTGEIITIACFGALSLYVISMVSFFKLRKSHPKMERPFKVPMYPLFPAVALIIASVSLVAMSYYNQMLALIFFGIMGLNFIAFKIFIKTGALAVED